MPNTWIGTNAVGMFLWWVVFCFSFIKEILQKVFSKINPINDSMIEGNGWSAECNSKTKIWHFKINIWYSKIIIRHFKINIWYFKWINKAGKHQMSWPCSVRPWQHFPPQGLSWSVENTPRKIFSLHGLSRIKRFGLYCASRTLRPFCSGLFELSGA